MPTSTIALIALGVIGFGNLYFIVNEIRTGVLRVKAYGEKFERKTKPRLFWLNVALHIAVVFLIFVLMLLILVFSNWNHL